MNIIKKNYSWREEPEKRQETKQGSGYQIRITSMDDISETE